MPLEMLYQNVILDHYKNPRNYGTLSGAAVRMRHENPLCGDHIDLYLELHRGEIIRNIAFEGRGCALSRASASMMSVAVKDQSLVRVKEIMTVFRALLHDARTPMQDMGELQVFAGVSEYPTRLPCALLPWQALAEHLNGSFQH